MAKNISTQYKMQITHTVNHK